MKYTFTEPNLTIEQANRLLAVLWGTCDDFRIDPSQLNDFVKDRIDLYSKLGKAAVISLSVEFVQ
jgi:hypothetical protein